MIFFWRTFFRLDLICTARKQTTYRWTFRAFSAFRVCFIFRRCRLLVSGAQDLLVHLDQVDVLLHDGFLKDAFKELEQERSLSRRFELETKQHQLGSKRVALGPGQHLISICQQGSEYLFKSQCEVLYLGQHNYISFNFSCYFVKKFGGTLNDFIMRGKSN